MARSTLSDGMASRAQEKQRAREARLAAEAADLRVAARRRRLTRLGLIAAVAVVAVVVAVVLSRGGASQDAGGGLQAQRAAVARQFAGLPQQGSVLGAAKAGHTLVEFADLQCPICRRYTLEVLPTVLSEYVRPGKLKLDLKLRTFLGPDSVKAGKVAAAAAEQSRVWPFAELFYRNQGTENTGYVTQDFLRRIASATPGLNGRRALADADSAAAAKRLQADESLANALRSDGTPDFYLRRGDGGPLTRLQPADLTPAAFRTALDAALGDGAGT
jgi:protein-disulfide isomerase